MKKIIVVVFVFLNLIFLNGCYFENDIIKFEEEIRKVVSKNFPGYTIESKHLIYYYNKIITPLDLDFKYLESNAYFKYKTTKSNPPWSYTEKYNFFIGSSNENLINNELLFDVVNCFEFNMLYDYIAYNDRYKIDDFTQNVYGFMINDYNIYF